jgi:hypothetical protein
MEISPHLITLKTAFDASFSLKYQFNEPGIHPAIFRVDSKNFSSLSSFSVRLPKDDGK